MISLPTGLPGRLLAVGLNVAVLGTVWLGAVQPLLAWHADRAQALMQRKALALRMAAVAREVPALQAQSDTAAKKGGAVERLLNARSDALAGAMLQGRLETMASENGVTLTSVETLPAQPIGAYRRISLRLSVNGSWPQLIGLITAIEHATPSLIIDDLQLHAGALQAVRGRSGASEFLVANTQQYQATAAGRPAPPPTIAVFTVFGFRAGSVAPEGAAVQPATP